MVARAKGMENLAAALFQLEFTQREEVVQLLLELSRWVTNSAPKPLQRSLYRFIVRWVKQKIPEGNFPEEMSAFEESVPMLAARLDQWEKEAYAEGIEKGIEKGILQGIEQGIERGLHNMLSQQLQKRFGTLPTSATLLIEQASPTQLENAILAVLDAKSLQDVLVQLGS